jgi:Uncharacterized protein conserved in bacteria (DUF2334)
VHWLDPVRAAIDGSPAPVEVFFRDDDAGWAPDRLRALLDRFEHHELPVDLAVIPAALGETLAAELRVRATTQRLGLHQHGFAHRNHEPDGRKYEFGPHRAPDRQRCDIEAGAARMADLLGDLVQPIFTPPWNRCTVDTGRCLAELGLSVLSRESRAAPLEVPGLDEVPIRIDFVKPDRAEQLATAVAEGGPIGVMLHHAVMDRENVERADELLALVATHPRVRASAILDYAARVPFPGWGSSDSVSRRSGARAT